MVNTRSQLKITMSSNLNTNENNDEHVFRIPNTNVQDITNKQGEEKLVDQPNMSP